MEILSKIFCCAVFTEVFFFNLPFLKLYLCLVDTWATAKNSWEDFLDLSKAWNLEYL